MIKNIMKFIISIVVIIVILSIIIVVYSFYDKAESNEDISGKLEQEMGYVDTTLVAVINSLNNLNADYLITNNQVKANSESSNNSSSSENISISTIEPQSILTRDRNNIDWVYIETKLEEINNSWAVITIDLNSIDVPNDEILNFTSNMDSALNYVKIKDKQNSLISVANLYSLLPKYENQYINDDEKIQLKYIKSDVISSYALLETNKWDSIANLVNDADIRMSTLINNNSDSKKFQNIEKKYILLKDYIKSINDKNLDLCYMKYYYFIKSSNY